MTPVKESSPAVREYIVSVFTENQVGVLARITSIFSRRKLNIESLRVSESKLVGISSFTITTFTSAETIERVVASIQRIIEVIWADYHPAEEMISQQIALYKVSSEFFKNGADGALREHNARILEITPAYVVLERTGFQHEIEALRKQLAEKGILLQFNCSGNITLHNEATEEVLRGLLSNKQKQ